MPGILTTRARAGNLDPLVWTTLAAGVAGWFGRAPVLVFVDWAEFDRRAGAERAETTRQRTVRSITASIARARQVLGYAPRFSLLDALHEALTWLVANGEADVGGSGSSASGIPVGTTC